jgi:hypothetical protein
VSEHRQTLDECNVSFRTSTIEQCGVGGRVSAAGISPQEVDMYARKVCVPLKPNALSTFTRLMECELLPWLQTQEGFLDLITLSAPDGIEVQAISFWERAGSAKAESSGYPESVLRTLEELLDGVPRGKTFEVVSSTLERFAPPRLHKTESIV